MNLSDFPPDVQGLAIKFGGTSMDTEADRKIIASAIMADRAGRVDVTGLTPQQANCLRAIAEHQARSGVTPSFDELASVLGLASKSGVYRLVEGLVRRGRVKRAPGRSRAITIISTPAS